MVIKIQTREIGIPVEIGELKFTISTSDENVERIVTQGSKLFEDFSEVKDVAKAKEALKEGFDFLLGEGAFEKIYKQTSSVVQCMDIFTQLMEQLGSEFKKFIAPSQQQKAQQYLQHKKHRSRKYKTQK